MKRMIGLSLMLVGISAIRGEDPGLRAWRKPDARGQACASCHSPDGIELSAYGFTSDNVKRRGFAHLSGKDVDEIAAMIAARRVSPTLNSLSDRPMQPGPDVAPQPLPGATPEARDEAFAQELAKQLPELAGPPIASMEEALKLKDRFSALDVRKLRTGIPLNRLSEDGFHGSDHASLANWIPDVPVFAATPEEQDRYLADPSDANFAAILPPLSKEGVTTMAAISIAKARALAYLQHDLRHGRTLANSTMPPDVAWWVGEVARSSEGFEISLLQSPDAAIAKKINGPALRSQLADIRLAWFWLGFTLDPSLQHVSTDKAAQRGDYFSLALWKDGPYPVHNMFMMTRRMLSEAFVPGAWVKSPPQRYTLMYGGFVNDDRAQKELKSPLGRKLTSNAFRMALWLQIDECRRRGWVMHRDPLLQQATAIEGCLNVFAPENRPADQALLQSYRKTIEESGRPPKNP